MRRIAALLTAIIIAAGLCGCSENESGSENSSKKSISSSISESAAESSPTETSAASSVASAETTTTTAPEVTDGVKRIDPFEGLEVQFDGIAPYVNVSFNNSKCPKEVQDNITFTYDDTVNYNNGDKVIVKAELNEQAEDTDIELLVDEKDYTVQGLPYYLDDVTGIDTSVLDKEIQDYMNAHYLDSDGGFGMVDHIMGADVFDGSGFGKVCNGSEVENTYLCVLKPNQLDANEINNYYFKVYNNTYLLTDGKIGDHDINVYACIYVKNIVAYPDGTLKYDPELGHNANKMKEVAYFEGISNKGDKYNIKEI